MIKTVLIVEDEPAVRTALQSMLERAGYTAISVAGSLHVVKLAVEKNEPDIVFVDIHLKGKLTAHQLVQYLNNLLIPFVYIADHLSKVIMEAVHTDRSHGLFLKPLQEQNVLAMMSITNDWYRYKAGAVERKEAIIQQYLNSIQVMPNGWEQTLLHLAKIIQPYLPFDYLVAGFKSTGELAYNALGFLRTGLETYQVIGVDELLAITGLKIGELTGMQLNTQTDNNPVIYDEEAFKLARKSPSMKRLSAEFFQVTSHMVLPLPLKDGRTFSFFFYSRRLHTYRPEHLDLFEKIRQQLTDTIEKMLSTQANALRVTDEAAQLDNNPATRSFDGVIGNTGSLLHVLDKLIPEAKSREPILILGETGTGKKKIAGFVHRFSGLEESSLIKLNCKELSKEVLLDVLSLSGSKNKPTTEKPNITTQGTCGTILLEEVGELPHELQEMLAELLQLQSGQQTTNKTTCKRIIATSSISLEKEVAEARFRPELYYRLNMISVTMPSLRKHKADIPQLANYFAEQLSAEIGKKFKDIAQEMMAEMMAYHWPGNINELKNCIDAAVQKNNGKTRLQLPRSLGETTVAQGK